MIEKIKKHMKDMTYIDKKARVFKYGDLGENFYIILHGFVRVLILS